MSDIFGGTNIATKISSLSLYFEKRDLEISVILRLLQLPKNIFTCCLAALLLCLLIFAFSSSVIVADPVDTTHSKSRSFRALIDRCRQAIEEDDPPRYSTFESFDSNIFVLAQVEQDIRAFGVAFAALSPWFLGMIAKIHRIPVSVWDLGIASLAIGGASFAAMRPKSGAPLISNIEFRLFPIDSGLNVFQIDARVHAGKPENGEIYRYGTLYISRSEDAGRTAKIYFERNPLFPLDNFFGSFREFEIQRELSWSVLNQNRWKRFMRDF